MATTPENASTPPKDLTALEKETPQSQEEEKEQEEDAAFLANLTRDSKEFDKDREIARIRSAFRANAYDVLDLQPGVPDEDVRKTYRRKSLLIHPDKTSNPHAQDAFDRLAKAYQMLQDEKQRAVLDEAIADARMLVMRDLGLGKEDERVKDPDTVFVGKWKDKVKWVLADMEARRQRQMKAQMQDEGRRQKQEDAEIAERKRKREHEQDWEKTRDQRIGSWREFSKKSEDKKDGKGKNKKKMKMKTLG